mmetsp:Transcript_6441/g.7367  ORF Transcript_6441/g.7367 Transcript_6441/m.7367 type:complete len:264 (-) Transcript_6441:889-1680(-)|eukprot:CAMPEP_0184005826 /NCGR_PEP_ID=MMETSP0954-20121128/294_1 /TAXON_ID=627963 /ORGANISM="Aplanochytrium sp, Strain PBS07" /LENGTH=263 /DNA_ID=CAMNT_0026284189 /DNA_START=21 /DNA_END=812 /DNA_ORIENTATION=-
MATSQVTFINFPEDRFVSQEGLKNVLTLALASQIPGCLGEWDHPRCPYNGTLDRSTIAIDPIDPEFNLHWVAVDAEPADVRVVAERKAFADRHLHGSFAGDYKVKVNIDIRALEVGFMFRRYNFKPTSLEIECEFRIDQFFVPGSRLRPGEIKNTRVKFSNKLKLTKVVSLSDPFSCCVRLAKPVVDLVAAPIVEGKITKILETQLNEALQDVKLQQWLTFEQYARATEAVVDTTKTIIDLVRIMTDKPEKRRRSSSGSCTIS